MFNTKTAVFAVLASIAVLGCSSAAHALTFSSPRELAAWTALHTEAPSHFSAPVSLAHFGGQPQFQSMFSGPATGPTGAQFGRLPTNNNSFIDPTRNSVNAHQTQNSTQASNAMEVRQAMQGRNCSLMLIRAGLCQGR